jgi:hypothetical protein
MRREEEEEEEKKNPRKRVTLKNWICHDKVKKIQENRFHIRK